MDDGLGDFGDVFSGLRAAGKQRRRGLARGMEHVSRRGGHADDDAVYRRSDDVMELSSELSYRLHYADRRLGAGVLGIHADRGRSDDRAFNGSLAGLGHIGAELSRAADRSRDDILYDRPAYSRDPFRALDYADDGIAHEAGGLSGNFVGSANRAIDGIDRRMAGVRAQSPGATNRRRYAEQVESRGRPTFRGRIVRLITEIVTLTVVHQYMLPAGTPA